MKYEDLSIHQRITAKGLVTNKKEQGEFANDSFFPCIHAIWKLSNFKEAINMLLFKITE